MHTDYAREFEEIQRLYASQHMFPGRLPDVTLPSNEEECRVDIWFSEGVFGLASNHSRGDGLCFKKIRSSTLRDSLTEYSNVEDYLKDTILNYHEDAPRRVAAEKFFDDLDRILMGDDE